jgi:ABC-type transport system involved in multi-copper enzyme maturation permease subunit
VTGSHGVRMQYDYSHDLAGPATPAAAQWLRLTRSGDTITGQESADGSHWTTIGTAHLAGLPASAQAGMFVASPVYVQTFGDGDNSSQITTRATAAFRHLSLHGGSAGQTWTGSVIGPQAPPAGNPPPGQQIGPKTAQLQPHQGFTSRAGSYQLNGSGDIAPFVPIVDPMHVVFMATLFGLIAVIGLGTVFVTAEYRRSLIRTTLTASPRRGRILAAKSIVVGSVTFIAALAGAAIAFPIVVTKLVSSGWKPPVWPELSITSSTGLQIVLGIAATAAAAAILGLAAGTIFRRSSAAIMAVLGVLVVPLILAIVMPLSVGTWLLRLTPAAAFSLEASVPHYSQVSYACAPYHACFPLDPWPGYAVMAAWTVAALAGAIYLLRRRDA